MKETIENIKEILSRVVRRNLYNGLLFSGGLDTVWQSKRPLEYGSGMTKIRKIISDKISDNEFKKACFYKIYQ